MAINIIIIMLRPSLFKPIHIRTANLAIFHVEMFFIGIDAYNHRTRQPRVHLWRVFNVLSQETRQVTAVQSYSIQHRVHNSLLWGKISPKLHCEGIRWFQ